MPPRRSPPLLAHLVALLIVGEAAAWAPPLGSQAAAPALAPALAPPAPDAEVARYLRSEMAARSIPGLAWAAVEDGAIVAEGYLGEANVGQAIEGVDDGTPELQAFMAELADCRGESGASE